MHCLAVLSKTEQMHPKGCINWNIENNISLLGVRPPREPPIENNAKWHYFWALYQVPQHSLVHIISIIHQKNTSPLKLNAILPIMTDQVSHKKSFSPAPASVNLAAVLTGDVRHYPHRINSPLHHHPFEPLSVEIHCHFIFENGVTGYLQKWITLLWKRHQYFRPYDLWSNFLPTVVCHQNDSKVSENLFRGKLVWNLCLYETTSRWNVYIPKNYGHNLRTCVWIFCTTPG